MHCPVCQTENSPTAASCTKCSTPLPLNGQTLEGAVPSDTLPADAAPSSASAWSVAVTPPANAPYSQGEELVGMLLAERYEILELLGQGGMGAVYKARDTELGRLVALKLIRADLASNSEILRRFKQELILAREVTHRNVIRIFDLGHAKGFKFITMEFVEGRDLRAVLRERGKLPLDETVRIIAQICRALESAHAVGVVHRDLKPQNIMLDGKDRVYVMDFGIAHSLEAPGMTLTGALIGTPEYMSPEQAKGTKVDARSDLFALGIIFYEMLAGISPYQADTALATLLKRTQERPPPPAEVDSTIPKAISDVIMKCLEIDRDHRYSAAREILEDLGHEMPTSVRSVAPTLFPTVAAPKPTAVSLSRRHRIWIAGAAAVVLLAGLGIVFRGNVLSFGEKRAAPVEQTSLAILPFHNASTNLSIDWLGSSLVDMLSTGVGQSSRLRTVSSDRIHQILKDLRVPPNADFDPDTLRRLAEFSGAEILVWGQYAKFGEQIRIDATLQDLKHNRRVPLKIEAKSDKEIPGTIDQLADLIRKNLAVSPDVLKELKASSFQPTSKSVAALRDYNDGLELARQGNHLEAAKRFEASVHADPEFALAYSKLGLTYSNLRNDDKAEQFSRKAVDLSENLPPQEQYLIQANYALVSNDNRKAIESYENLEKVSPDDVDVHFHLGGLYETIGAYDKARVELATVLAIDPKHVDALLAAGRVEVRSNNPQSSLDYLNRGLSLAVELDNADAKATILNAIGAAYKQLNKPEEALRNYEESLTIKRSLGQKPGIALSLGNIAQVQAGLGKPEEANKSYQEAVKLQREIGDKKGLGVTLIGLGGLYKAREQYDEALKAYKESLQIQRDVGNESNQALCLNNIGNVYLAKGQSSDALTYYERALELRKKANIPSQVGETLHNLAEASLKVGDYGQSLDYHLKALELFRTSGDKRGAAIQSYSMGTIFEYQGRYGAALKSKEDALKTFRELHDRGFWMAEILSGYGNSLSQVGRYDEAQTNLAEAMTLARELQNKTLIAQTLNFQGDTFYYRGDVKSAADLFSQALAATSSNVERDVVLLSKLNSAKCLVKENRNQAAIPPLKALVQQADAVGLKHLSTEAALALAEALLNDHQYAAARKHLEASLRTSEKLGLQALLARSHHLLAQTLQRSGKLSAEAAPHYAAARRILETIHQESGSDGILKRQDLSSISSPSVQ